MFNHWTEEEKARLDSIETFREAADMAITILTRMREEFPGTRVVQLCGPMTTGGAGNLEENMRRFARAITSAREEGHLVFNQMPFQSVIIRITDHHAGGEYRMDILEEFYKPVFESGLVDAGLFLPGWGLSRGSVWERNTLETLGLTIEECPRHWVLEPAGA